MSYFGELFGTPELQKREGWNGQEELTQQAAETIRKAWERDTSDPTSSAYNMPLAPDTIDIDYEEVD